MSKDNVVKLFADPADKLAEYIKALEDMKPHIKDIVSVLILNSDDEPYVSLMTTNNLKDIAVASKVLDRDFYNMTFTEELSDE